jgi:hypothetical protein
MSKFQAALNPRQLQVLEWIATGCPPGVTEETAHTLTALALQNRHLVIVSKKGGRWSASVTDAGRYYLVEGRYPDDSRDRPVEHPLRRSSVVRTSAATSLPSVERPIVPPKRDAVIRPTPPTVQLVEDVIAAGGALRINRTKDRKNYEMLISSAIRFGKVPSGKWLVLEHASGSGDVTIRLKDAPEWQTAELRPLPIPTSLRKPHRIVTLLQQGERIAVTKSVRMRALRLLQGLIVEAEARGFVVKLGEDPHQYRGRVADQALITIGIKGHSIGLRLRQEIDRTPHVATTAELREQERYSWHRIPSHDERLSRRLSLHLTSGREYQQSVWKDGKRSSLDDVLAQILQEIELRAGFAEDAQMEAERARIERQRRWEAAMARAKVELVESHRNDTFLQQAESWRQIKLLRDYLAAMTGAVAVLEDADERAVARAWIDWCTESAEQKDPLAGPLRMPDDP